MYVFLKRFMDLSLSFVLLMLLFPVFIIVAMIIKISDNGPVFYRQKRVGVNGWQFDLYKFRSMKYNSVGTFYTQENDPRITSIGKIIRRLSIDELPQLINVLKGDMSLVGPRPDVESQQIEYNRDDKSKRNSVLPGITGLAQATRRSLATPDERMMLDLKYVDERSLLLDFEILVLTFVSIFKRNSN